MRTEDRIKEVLIRKWRQATSSSSQEDQEEQVLGLIEQIHDDDDLLVKFNLDSLSMIQIITALEEEFDVEFPDDSLDLNEFQSIRKMAAQIEKALGS